MIHDIAAPPSDGKTVYKRVKLEGSTVLYGAICSGVWCVIRLTVSPGHGQVIESKFPLTFPFLCYAG